MAKAKVNVNGGGARVLNVRTTPRPTPSPSRGEGGGLGRMQFPPDFGGKYVAGFELGNWNNPSPTITGTLSGGSPNYVTLNTKSYTNKTDKAQALLVLAECGQGYKQSGTGVISFFNTVLMADGVAVTQASSEGFVDGGNLGTRTHMMLVKPGQTVNFSIQMSIGFLSGSMAFAFVNNRIGVMAWRAE